MWPRVWSNSVKNLGEGSERVQAVEINTTEGSLCIISVYLPTFRLPTSKELYQENLDVVHHIIQTYANTHKIIVCGDFNGSLSDTSSDPHDMMLKAFVEEHNLHKHPSHGDIQIFIGHGGSTSLIDYVLTKCHGLITQVSIKEKFSLNMSSHVPVWAQLSILKSTINMCV